MNDYVFLNEVYLFIYWLSPTSTPQNSRSTQKDIILWQGALHATMTWYHVPKNKNRFLTFWSSWPDFKAKHGGIFSLNNSTTFGFYKFCFRLIFTRDWSRKHIFIIFEGLSSQIVSQLWTKHYTQCPYNIWAGRSYCCCFFLQVFKGMHFQGWGDSWNASSG